MSKNLKNTGETLKMIIKNIIRLFCKRLALSGAGLVIRYLNKMIEKIENEYEEIKNIYWKTDFDFFMLNRINKEIETLNKTIEIIRENNG